MTPKKHERMNGMHSIYKYVYRNLHFLNMNVLPFQLGLFGRI